MFYMDAVRLQNSPYFCVFKYARTVKQEVWKEAENGEPDWAGERRYAIQLTLTLTMITPQVAETSGCQQQQSYSRLHLHGRFYLTYPYDSNHSL